MKEVKQQIIDGEFDVFDQGTITDQTARSSSKTASSSDGLPDAFDATVRVGTPGDAINDGMLLGHELLRRQRRRDSIG